MVEVVVAQNRLRTIRWLMFCIIFIPSQLQNNAILSVLLRIPSKMAKGLLYFSELDCSNAPSESGTEIRASKSKEYVQPTAKLNLYP